MGSMHHPTDDATTVGCTTSPTRGPGAYGANRSHTQRTFYFTSSRRNTAAETPYWQDNDDEQFHSPNGAGITDNKSNAPINSANPRHDDNNEVRRLVELKAQQALQPNRTFESGRGNDIPLFDGDGRQYKGSKTSTKWGWTRKAFFCYDKRTEEQEKIWERWKTTSKRHGFTQSWSNSIQMSSANLKIPWDGRAQRKCQPSKSWTVSYFTSITSQRIMKNYKPT